MVAGPLPGQHVCVRALRRGLAGFGCAEGGAPAIMTARGLFFFQHVGTFAEPAHEHRLPSFSWKPAADAGVLMSAGTDIAASRERRATFVDRLLGGEAGRASHRESTTLGREVDSRTARLLGVAIPYALRVRPRGEKR